MPLFTWGGDGGGLIKIKK